MDTTIFLFLMQDGLTSGAIYALLGLALVLVFAVTRVIFIPQGELVAYGALTAAIVDQGRTPATVWLLVAAGFCACVADLWAARRNLNAKRICWTLAGDALLPLAIAGATAWLAPMRLAPVAQLALTAAIVAPLGAYLYAIAFRPLASASVLTLFIAAVGVHLAMTGLGLLFFGAEGLRGRALSDASLPLGPLIVTGQSLWIYGVALATMIALAAFFGRTLMGKALVATAMNRVGARLVGVRPDLSGRLAFTLAALIGAVSGVLIAPMTTVFYDTGFLIGLKGFVAAIIGAMMSYPITALAAILVGCVEAFASFYASNFKEVIVFTLIVPILLWRSLAAGQTGEED